MKRCPTKEVKPQETGFATAATHTANRLGSLLAAWRRAGNGRRQLGAIALPVGQTVVGDTQGLFGAGGYRVVEAETLDEAAVTTVTRIGGNDNVNRGRFLAPPRQGELQPLCCLPESEKGRL